MQIGTSSTMAFIVALVIAASSFGVEPGRAQTAAQAKQTAAPGKAQAAADECLSKPSGASPRGSHWYYRIDRQTKRKCWYLGPEKTRARQAAPAATERQAAPAERPAPAAERLAPVERKAARTPAPTPRPALADEERSAEPAARATAHANEAPTGSVAPQVAAAWPVVPYAGGMSDRAATTQASDRAATPPAAEPAAAEAQPATADAQPEDPPLVWPALTPADRTAAAQANDAAPGLGSLLLFLMATVAFVAIAFRAVLKLASSWRGNRTRRLDVRPASPVIRRRTAQPAASEPQVEELLDPTVARLREVARRWETAARVARQPRIPAYEVVSDYEVETPPTPRRRRVA